MSTTQRQPSGALAICTGRKKQSREARNSRPGSASRAVTEQAARLRDRAMDEVVGHLADEQVAAELGRVGVAAIDGHPGRAGEEARRRAPLVRARERSPGSAAGSAGARQGSTGLRRKSLVNLPAGATFTAAAGARRYGFRAMYRLSYITRWNGSLLPQTYVRPQSSRRHPVLAAAAGQLERLVPRVEEEAIAAHRDRPRRRAIAAAHRSPPSSPVEMWKRLSSPHRNELSIPSPAGSRAEPGEDDAAHVGLAVAVGVLEVEQVRRRARVDAAVPAGDRGRHRHVGGEQRALLVDAVAVDVLEHPDAAPFATPRVLLRDRGVLVVLGELGDIEPPVLVEVDGDRAAQQRLGGDQLDAEPGPRHDGPLRFGRALHREPGQLGAIVLIGGVPREGGLCRGEGGPCAAEVPPRRQARAAIVQR